MMANRPLTDDAIARALGGEAGAPPELVGSISTHAHSVGQRRSLAPFGWLFEPRPRSRLWQLVLLTLLIAALVAIAAGAGSLLSTPRPEFIAVAGQASGACGETLPSPASITSTVEIQDSPVTIDLAGLAGRGFSVEAGRRRVGIGDGVAGFGYGFEETTEGFVVPAYARGVLLADVTTARSHGPATGGILVGSNASDFVNGLSEVIRLEVSDIRAAMLAGAPATRAFVSSEPLRVPRVTGWMHIDAPPHGAFSASCLMDFTLPSEVIVGDLGRSIVLVQIWAATEDELRAWIPTANEIIDSIGIGTRAAP